MSSARLVALSPPSANVGKDTPAARACMPESSADEYSAGATAVDRPRRTPARVTGFPHGFCYLRLMSRALSLCGVILSAGDSSRMGTDKALLPWPPVAPGQASGGTFLSAAIRSLTLYTDFVLVVAGRNEASLAPIVYSNGAFLVANPNPERGQFSSLQVGLQEVLNRGRDAAMVTLVDRPPVSTATIDKLREAFESAVTRWKWAVVPEHGGRHGHPIVLGREMIEAFLKAPVSATARDIEHNHREHILYLPLDDPLVTVNVNTPDEYAALVTSVGLAR